MSWLQWSLTHSYWEKILYKNLQHNIREVHKGEKPREKDLQPKMCVQFCGVFFSSILGYLLEGGHNAHNAYCLELVLEMSLHMVQTFCWEEGNKGRRVLWLERHVQLSKKRILITSWKLVTVVTKNPTQVKQMLIFQFSTCSVGWVNGSLLNFSKYCIFK